MVQKITLTADTIGAATGPVINKIIKDKGFEFKGWEDMSLPQKKIVLIEHISANGGIQNVSKKSAALSDKPPTVVTQTGKPPKAKAAKAAKAAKKPKSLGSKSKILVKEETAIPGGKGLKFAPGKEPTGTEIAIPQTGEIISGKTEGLVEASDLLATIDSDNAPLAVTHLLENIDKCMFILGGVLAKISTNGWFGGRPDFSTYVEEVHGMKYRKAAYLMQIYKTLTNLAIPSEKFINIGWSKAKEILVFLGTDEAKNDFWIEKAETLSLTQLVHDVKEAKGKVKKADIKKKYFLLHEGEQTEAVDLALKKAMTDDDIGGENEALALICHEFIGKPMMIKAGVVELPDVPLIEGAVMAYFVTQAKEGGAEAKQGFENAINLVLKSFGVELSALQIKTHPSDWPTNQ